MTATAAGAGSAAPHPEPTARWTARPLVARALRVAVVLLPPVTAVLVGASLSRRLPTPNGFPGHVLWWAAILAISTVALVVVDRVVRRALPLAALLQLSVLFPGRAPSRFAVARQAGSTRRLAELVRRAEAAAIRSEPIVAAERILALVAALDGHDRRTHGHAERVRVFTDLIAEELRLPEPDRDRLRWAALLHDIGKINVPPTLLNKAGRPSSTEWDVLRRHPDEGSRLAAPLLPWLGEWGSVIDQHHERYDGLGYPRGLAGTAICRGARIVAVADSFEVMTAPRTYKRAMTRAAALQELARCAGSQFDPAIVRALMQVSTPRLRWAIGPLSWLAQVPVVYPVSNSGVAGQAAAGIGVLAIGGAVGLSASGARASDVPTGLQALSSSVPNQAAVAATELAALRAGAGPAGSTGAVRIGTEAERAGAPGRMRVHTGDADEPELAEPEDASATMGHPATAGTAAQPGPARQAVSRVIGPVEQVSGQVAAALPNSAPKAGGTVTGSTTGTTTGTVAGTTSTLSGTTSTLSAMTSDPLPVGAPTPGSIPRLSG
ncbi:MAG: hypothetical protein NVSMB13_07330 [Mycobacteriales bacterium]